METLLDIFIEILPVIILAGTVIYLFHEYLRYLDQRRNKAEEKAGPSTVAAPQRSETVLKLQLQAAERFTLYLERINPGRLVMRIHRNGMSATMLQNEILRTIREEYDHNLSQQIYISEGSWELISKAKEETLKLINAAGDGLPKNASSLDYSRRLFEAASRIEKLPSEIALEYLRKETRLLFRR
jgi:hypothetical protein